MIPVPPKRLRILVVDDHLDAALSLATLTREIGHDAKFATSGDAALEIAKRFRPDVIFLDLVLPDIEGPDLARHLRAQAGCEHARIMVVSGYGADEDRRRSREAGCDGHFVKPLSPAFLEDLLKNHV
jgi:two-component system CheB/CheR fusion protein